MEKGSYIIKNTENGKVYVGASTNLIKRRDQHFNNLELGKHYNSDLQIDYNNYGKDKFIFIVVEQCYEDERLDELEKRAYDSFDEKYNKQRNFAHTNKETKKKMRISKIREKNPMYGKRGEKSPYFGTNRSEEIKKKISESRRGHKISDETRHKMSLAKRNMSNETRLKMSLAKLGIKKNKKSLQKETLF